jgi:DNA-binding NarL/FixJ family response regulator
VILDLAMPDMNGVEVASALQRCWEWIAGGTYFRHGSFSQLSHSIQS